MTASDGNPTLDFLCTKPRNIGEDQVAEGAKIVGAAAVVEEIVNGAKSVACA